MIYFAVLVAPALDKTALSDMKVKAGQPISFNVHFTGEPTPEVQWSVNDKHLVPSNRTTVQNTETGTVLTTRPSERGDSGQYRLTIKNTSGSDTAACIVTVVGKFKVG